MRQLGNKRASVELVKASEVSEKCHPIRRALKCEETPSGHVKIDKVTRTRHLPECPQGIAVPLVFQEFGQRLADDALNYSRKVASEMDASISSRKIHIEFL